MFQRTSLRFGVATAPFILASALLFCNVPTASAEEQRKAAPEQLVDGLRSVFGKHHARAVHAKGILLEGSFTPTAEAKSLSKASLFAGGTIPATVRFSDFTGIPDISDATGDANPRGLALKFKLPDGSDTDIVTHSFNGFPVPTAEEFVTLLQAIATSGPDAAKPTALDKYFETHPVAKKFLTTQKAVPESYASITYFGVNSFAFTSIICFA